MKQSQTKPSLASRAHSRTSKVSLCAPVAIAGLSNVTKRLLPFCLLATYFLFLVGFDFPGAVVMSTDIASGWFEPDLDLHLYMYGSI
jgi:hypothetical protein